MATLSISKVIGLDLSQVSINSDRNIEFNNIKHDMAIGVGWITIRATDQSGNYSEQELLFGVVPNIPHIINIKKGTSITIQYPVMPNLDTISITQPNNSFGMSASAYLAEHEAFIIVTASDNADHINKKGLSFVEVTLSDKIDKVLISQLALALEPLSN